MQMKKMMRLITNLLFIEDLKFYGNLNLTSFDETWNDIEIARERTQESIT